MGFGCASMSGRGDAMTARERWENAVRACTHGHVLTRPCPKCSVAAIIAHAEAVREDCAKATCKWCRDGHPLNLNGRHTDKDGQGGSWTCHAAAIRGFTLD